MGPSLVTQHGAGAKPPGPGNDSSPSAGRAWSKILAFGSAARPRLGLCQRLLEGVPLVPVPAAGDPSWAVSPCPAGGFAAAPQHDAPHPDPIYWGGRAPRQGAGVVDGTFLNEHEPWGGQVAAPMSPLPPALRAPGRILPQGSRLPPRASGIRVAPLNLPDLTGARSLLACWTNHPEAIHGGCGELFCSNQGFHGRALIR